MSEQWVVNLVQNAPPTEVTVGPFASAEEASGWVSAMRAEQQFLRVQVIVLTPPYEVGSDAIYDHVNTRPDLGYCLDCLVGEGHNRWP